MKEEEIGGVDLCHCTRALLHALFVVLGPLAKRKIVECSQLSCLYKMASNFINRFRREIIIVFNFNSIYSAVLWITISNCYKNITVFPTNIDITAIQHIHKYARVTWQLYSMFAGLFPAYFSNYLFNFKLNLVF